jgi:hypothetical protein
MMKRPDWIALLEACYDASQPYVGAWLESIQEDPSLDKLSRGDERGISARDAVIAWPAARAPLLDEQRASVALYALICSFAGDRKGTVTGPRSSG